MSRKAKKIRKLIFDVILSVLACVICLGPLVWCVSTSLKPNNEILAQPPVLVPENVTTQHYQDIMNSGFGSSLQASLFYAAITIIAGLLMGILAAYGFDRFRIKGGQGLFFMVVASIPMSIGSSSVLIPTYMYLSNLNMIDKWYTLPILYTLYNLPMAIWILKGSFETVPKALDESARIDGCSSLGVLWRICIPLIKPGIVSAAMFLFIGAWNDYLSGSVMVTANELRNIQFSIYSYLGFFGREWGKLTAAATLELIPIIILFVILGRHLISGLTKGSVK